MEFEPAILEQPFFGNKVRAGKVNCAQEHSQVISDLAVLHLPHNAADGGLTGRASVERRGGDVEAPWSPLTH